MVGTRDRIISIADRVVNTVVIIVGLLILLISLYSIWDNMRLYHGAQDDSLLTFKPKMDGTAVISGNQVAWITINDTTVDYPVMQGKDNYEYLSINPYGEYALSGSIYLDYRNDSDFKDPYSVIYGHHMEHGAMFGALDGYREKAFFDTHRRGNLVTDQTVYALNIFATATVNAADQTVFAPNGRTEEEITEYLKERSEIFEVPEEGLQIIALSTCTADGSESRWVVFATMKERGKEVAR